MRVHRTQKLLKGGHFFVGQTLDEVANRRLKSRGGLSCCFSLIARMRRGHLRVEGFDELQEGGTFSTGGRQCRMVQLQIYIVDRNILLHPTHRYEENFPSPWYPQLWMVRATGSHPWAHRGCSEWNSAWIPSVLNVINTLIHRIVYLSCFVLA